MICNHLPTDHCNHGFSGWTWTYAQRLRLALHEIGHNLGAIHGAGDSDWAFLENALVVGDFCHQEADDLSVGRVDVLAGRQISSGAVQWWNGRTAPASYFDPALDAHVVYGDESLRPSYLRHSEDTGQAGDSFFAGDFNGDGRSDLGIARVVSPTQVQWLVALHQDASDKCLPELVWNSNVGEVETSFWSRTLPATGTTDLAIGHAAGGTTMEWTVAHSTGRQLVSSGYLWSTDAGDPGDTFLAGNADGDFSVDLIIRRQSSVNRQTVVQALVARSGGLQFFAAEVWSSNLLDTEDELLAGDFTGDGRDDLAEGHLNKQGQSQWRVYAFDGSSFLSSSPGGVWAVDLGSVGDRFFAGDVNGDGVDDILRAYLPPGRTSADPLRWDSYSSTGFTLQPAHSLSRDVCIWNTTPECGTSIMLYGYGYDISSRVVPAYSEQNAANISSVLSAFNARSP